MPATAIQLPSDSELLGRYLSEGCENSFAALVAAHQPMVLGTALRRTGDVELARDVAQQVFTLLARKAAWLTGRNSLAGWLHRSTCYLGARAVRHEARNRTRLEALAGETLTRPRDPAQWAALDDALAALGAKEREALVLRFFEDRGYPEMAALLGSSEVAARQRVSRGLRELGLQLRRRGITAPGAAVLAGGTALQATIPAQAGLATAALSSGAASSPFWLLATTVMSHTAAKIAVAAVILSAVPVVVFRHEHSRLLAASTASPPAPSFPASAAAPPARAAASGDDLLDAWNQHRAEQTRRTQAEEKLAALQKEMQRVETEVVVSYGQIEDLARRLVARAQVLNKLTELKSQPDPAARERLAREAGDLSDLFVLSREVQKLESDPEKAARFYATAWGEFAGLDEAGREPLLRLARERFTAMGRAGLIAANRPAKDDQSWQEARSRAFDQFNAALLESLPADRRTDAEAFSGFLDFSRESLFQ